MNEHKKHIQAIFDAAVARVRPYEMLLNQLSLNGSSLEITTEEVDERISLDRFERIIVLGAGKAGAPMARALEKLLGERITGGLISVKEGHVEPLRRIELIEAGHPVPNAKSVEAGRRILELARSGDARTLFVTLISGGGSALLVAPRRAEVDGEEIELTLEDLRLTTRALLACGAAIGEVNTIRKHLSEIKGGQLAAAMAPAHSISLILSDVVGDPLHAIASGVTSGDPTTFADSIALVERYRIRDRLPPRVLRVLEAGAAGKIPETPKPSAQPLSKVRNVLIGTNFQAVMAAADKAAELGYKPLVITTHLTGEAREAAKVIVGIARDVLARGLPVSAPACLLFGGETTVTLRGTGSGGRNQELALAALCELQSIEPPPDEISLLSGATDGTDGPTDAAGGFASTSVLEAARKARLRPAAYLANNDSYHFFSELGELLITGPTNTNVCDIQIVLVGSPQTEEE